MKKICGERKIKIILGLTVAMLGSVAPAMIQAGREQHAAGGEWLLMLMTVICGAEIIFADKRRSAKEKARR